MEGTAGAAEACASAQAAAVAAAERAAQSGRCQRGKALLAKQPPFTVHCALRLAGCLSAYK